MHFLSTLILAVWAATVSTSPIDTHLVQKRASGPDYDFSTVAGYFLQDDDSTDDTTFDPKTSNFGLKPIANKNAGETDWQAFTRIVDGLNQNAPSGTSYKVLFVGRHGQGYHNVAVDYYGYIPWGLYWGRKDGNGTVTWFDAELTPTGVSEAQALGNAWSKQISQQGTPAPQSYYVSPLSRTCATAKLTFGNLNLPAGRPFKPLIKEGLREILGVLTSQKRHEKSWIAARYPGYSFEQGFTQEDELWHSWIFELPFQLDARLEQLLTDVWASDKNTWISFTSHDKSIESLVKTVGHRKWDTGTADLLPMLVKATLKK